MGQAWKFQMWIPLCSLCPASCPGQRQSKKNSTREYFVLVLRSLRCGEDETERQEKTVDSWTAEGSRRDLNLIRIYNGWCWIGQAFKVPCQSIHDAGGNNTRVNNIWLATGLRCWEPRSQVAIIAPKLSAAANMYNRHTRRAKESARPWKNHKGKRLGNIGKKHTAKWYV